MLGNLGRLAFVSSCMRRRLLVIACLAASACGPAEDISVGTGNEPSSSTRYRVSATVLESSGHGPQLCQAVAESYPPQCGGPDVVGWDWASVEGEESASGTTWGAYEVTGTWDGTRLTLTELPGPPNVEAPDGAVDLSTPCPEPASSCVSPPERTLSELQAIQAEVTSLLAAET